jgi:hypothetical protein
MRWKTSPSTAGQFKDSLGIRNRAAATSQAIEQKCRGADRILSTVWSLVLAAATALVAGCETSGFKAVVLGSPYQPNNIFIAAPRLPGDLKRVAVLPLSCAGRQTDLAEGRDALGPVLIAELIKVKKFEVVPVPPGELSRLTGRMVWTSEEVLPAGLLGLLEKEYACDAVLFCELTEFRAYAPLAVGWRLKLVDVRSQKTIWAGDEHYDAGNPAVIAGARLYQRREQVAPGDNSGDWLAINSPRRFGQYSVDSLLGTLPAR